MSVQAEELVRIDAPGAVLQARVTGDPHGVPVLFLHGTSANGRVWDDVVSAVRTPICAVQLDQRGHGLSGDGDGYGAEQFADDAAAVIEHLSTEPVLVVGHSMGARNGWVLAVRRPELVRGVLAVDYTPYVEAEVLDALRTRVRAGDRTFQDLDDVRAYLRHRYPRLPEAAIARRAEHGYVREAAGLRPLARPEALAQLVEGLRTDYPEEYASVSSPMTSLRGEDSLIVSPTAWTAAASSAPHVRAVVVPGADHYVHEEQPVLVAGHIDRMIADAHRS